MAFKIRDGYTLNGQTSGQGNMGEPQPVLTFEYRPPLAESLNVFRYQVNTAPTGEAQHGARIKFLLARLVSWNAVDANDRPLPITAENLSMLPDPVLLDTVNECSKWRPMEEAPAAGN